MVDFPYISLWKRKSLMWLSKHKAPWEVIVRPDVGRSSIHRKGVLIMGELVLPPPGIWTHSQLLTAVVWCCLGASLTLVIWGSTVAGVFIEQKHNHIRYFPCPWKPVMFPLPRIYNTPRYTTLYHTNVPWKTGSLMVRTAHSVSVFLLVCVLVILKTILFNVYTFI